MGLIGLLIASVVNLTMANGSLDWILDYAALLIFLGLTAYDMQRLKERNVLGNAGTDEDEKEAIVGAVGLYLGLVNIFLRVLSIRAAHRAR